MADNPDGVNNELTSPTFPGAMRDRVYDEMNRWGACASALEWIQTLPEDTDLVGAFDLLENHDWALWFLHRVALGTDDANWGDTSECEVCKVTDPKTMRDRVVQKAHRLGLLNRY